MRFRRRTGEDPHKMARKKDAGTPTRPPDMPEPALPGTDRTGAEGADVDSGSALPFGVVAIGASAGGLPALTPLLGALATDSGMAFLVIQHLEPNHASMLTEILRRDTRLPVHEVTDGLRIEPDHVYVIPPGKDMVMDATALRLAPRTEIRGQHRPIDHFMRSLAEVQKDRAIGVVLSGTANDGTRGLEEIKAAGGITFAQDGTAEHSGMPRSAIAAGCVDFVLPPDRIGQELTRIARHPYAAPATEPAARSPPDSAPVAKVLEFLRQASGVDFSHYKRNTLHRRISRRMVLHRLEHLPDYVGLLQKDPAEADALYQDILINVTSFFRDPKAFEALKQTVFPRLVQDRSRHEPVRVWALGCSTGEEAYSIAMAYTEYIEAAGVRVPMQIFATDLNGAGIDKARSGIYPRGIAQDLSTERLRRFFVEVDGGYRIVKSIRDMCVFARQNALADPPFSHMSLVACRNMLIYLEPVLQQKLIPLLHYALRPAGFLWLGSSETIGTYRDLFDVEDAQHRIYLRKPGPSRPRVTLPQRSHAPLVPLEDRKAPPRGRDGDDAHHQADRLLLAHYSPPSVVVDGDFNVLQFRGDTGAYLAPAPGRTTFNLIKMLREGLLAPVRTALRKAQREERAIRSENLRVRSNGGYRDVTIVVLPMKGPNVARGTCLLLFEEPARQAEGRARQAEAEARAAVAKAADAPSGTTAETEVPRLQDELDEMRRYLQATTEQYENTTEELQSANEEVQSANEELQSANEELETSREEIQSSNEELATINDELQRRNDDLQQANNDLLNLIGSAQMPMVMLGPDLRIRRYTPSAEKLLNLIPTDVGRPLTDIHLKFTIPDLEAMLREVIETVAARELEVQDPEGRWYLLRIRPYKTLENRIEGAVLVLVDVDTLKRAEQDLRESDRRKDDFLAMLSHELRTPLAALRSTAEVLNAPHGSDGALAQARSVLDRQTRNMARLVDDLLDVARISHGTIQLRPVPTELAAAIRHVIDATAHEREATAQQLTLSLSARPMTVLADPVRLDQILGNLLTNASKFTPRGGHIWLSVQPEAPVPGNPVDPRHRHGHALIRVRDSGVGIDPAALSHVFEVFREMNRAPPHAGQGMGLGLTLARTLVELHGGTIEARSQGAGQGAELTVRLPLIADTAAAASPRPQPEPIPVKPRRILVVDDNTDAARIMRVLLELDGHTVEIAHDGPGALEAARRLKPEVGLLDLGIPGMDGFAIARRLRQEPGFDTLVIVAVTGYGRDEDVRRTREAGFDHHLTKPVERRKLQSLLAGVGGK